MKTLKEIERQAMDSVTACSTFNPFFDQEDPQVPVVSMIASHDKSEPYELDAAAVFKAKQGFLVVFVSGCSCWPDRGTTSQNHCNKIAEIDRILGVEWAALKDACQQKGWK
jgi:hypothetical protein